jgi:hypothetical protein
MGGEDIHVRIVAQLTGKFQAGYLYNRPIDRLMVSGNKQPGKLEDQLIDFR